MTCCHHLNYALYFFLKKTGNHCLNSSHTYNCDVLSSNSSEDILPHDI